jgi:DNA mismatch repair protein MutS
MTEDHRHVVPSHWGRAEAIPTVPNARGPGRSGGRVGSERSPSVLFVGSDPTSSIPTPEPAWFRDLNLDQFVSAITKGREDYDLARHFHSLVRDVRAIRHRQAVLADLEDEGLSVAVRTFSEQMRRVRGLLRSAEKLRHRWFRAGWLLDAAELYCVAVAALADELGRPTIRSEGLRDIYDYLIAYRRSTSFAGLRDGTEDLRRRLTEISYSITVRGSRVTVARYEEEPDYSAEVLATFAKFSQGSAKDYRVKLPERETNHVLGRVLDLVARLHPAVFSALDGFCARYAQFVDPVIERFECELQFYLAYLDYIAPLRSAGLPFSLPEVSELPDHVAADDAFDLVLAAQRVRDEKGIVLNGFELCRPERLIVVTGPNQGGKTTFARLFGQLHYLASIGLPVPARRAVLALPDRIFTHFERAEDLATLRGKLEDEVLRVSDIFEQASPRSVVVMNETFTSTTLEDALFLGREVIDFMTERGLLGVYVTFVDELARSNEATVSMVASVDPAEPTRRTFEIVRRPADGLAYAGAIAARYGLTYEAIRDRLAS